MVANLLQTITLLMYMNLEFLWKTTKITEKFRFKHLRTFLINGDYKDYDNIKVIGITTQETFNKFKSIKLQTDGQYVAQTIVLLLLRT